MILILGGAWQGKLAFAQRTYQLRDEDIFFCTGDEIDFSHRCICGLTDFARKSADPVAYFRAHRAQWEPCIFIVRDISCGVVPLGEENRLWRQKAGLLTQYLAREATRVSRIFCGLEQRLK